MTSKRFITYTRANEAMNYTKKKKARDGAKVQLSPTVQSAKPIVGKRRSVNDGELSQTGSKIQVCLSFR